MMFNSMTFRKSKKKGGARGGGTRGEKVTKKCYPSRGVVGLGVKLDEGGEGLDINIIFIKSV